MEAWLQDVQGNSPAERAGLQAQEDYVIASPDTLLHDQGSFAEQVKLSMFKPLRLFVYNRVSDTIREVTIIPDRDWGGAGRCVSRCHTPTPVQCVLLTRRGHAGGRGRASLGCDVGYGYLHRIPKPDPTRASQTRRQAPVSLSIPGPTPAAQAQAPPEPPKAALSEAQPA